MTRKKMPLRSIDERNQLVEKFRFLPRHVLKSLTNWTYRQPSDWDDAEQEGMKALLRASELWDKKQGVAFMTYAYRAIFNRLIHRFRTQKCFAALTPIHLMQAAEKAWTNRLRRCEQSEILATALQALNPISRMIVVRRFGLDGEAPEKSTRIALELGISRQAISSRCRKAMKFLKSELETYYGSNVAAGLAGRGSGAGFAGGD